MADGRGSDADAGPSVDVSEAIQFAESFPATETGGTQDAGSQQSPPPVEENPQHPGEQASEPAAGDQKGGKKKRTYSQVQMPSHDQIMQEEFMNNCAVRTGLSGVMGMGLGAAFGVAMGTFDTAGGGLDGSVDTTKQTTRQVLRDMWRNTSRKSWSYAKGFGAMGSLFAGSECVIEKARAKHDMYNSIYAGCFAGGALAHSAGPKGMCIGCASFAAFSYMIDRFMER